LTTRHGRGGGGIKTGTVGKIGGRKVPKETRRGREIKERNIVCLEHKGIGRGGTGWIKTMSGLLLTPPPPRKGSKMSRNGERKMAPCEVGGRTEEQKWGGLAKSLTGTEKKKGGRPTAPGRDNQIEETGGGPMGKQGLGVREKIRHSVRDLVRPEGRGGDRRKID